MNDIDIRKGMANLLVLQHGSYEAALFYCRYDDEQKILEFATKSIKKIDPMGGIPHGFPMNLLLYILTLFYGQTVYHLKNKKSCRKILMEMIC